MNKILFSIIMLSIGSTINAKTIIDYYNMLPEKIFEGEYQTEDNKWPIEGKHMKYNILKKGNKYYSTSVDGKEFEITVDINNGYLQIKDEGLNGAQASGELHEAALFIDSKNNKYIAISISHFSSYYDNYMFRFYKIQNNEFINYTSIIKNMVSVYNYIKKRNDYTKMKTFENHYGRPKFYFQIPRYGTTINVYIRKSNKFFGDSEEHLRLEKIQKEFFDNLERNVIKLNWIYTKGIFTLQY
jgi:hypothetical protein